MARMAIERYLADAEANLGVEAADDLWRRVQIGIVLAEGVRTTPRMAHEPDVVAPAAFTDGVLVSPREIDGWTDGAGLVQSSDALLAILVRKAEASRGLHAATMAKIGGRSLSEWLTPEVLARDGHKFLVALAASPVWIKPGHNAESSKLFRVRAPSCNLCSLLQEFAWGGRMFGVHCSARDVADHLGSDAV